jgi:hypothetical protein
LNSPFADTTDIPRIYACSFPSSPDITFYHS